LKQCRKCGQWQVAGEFSPSKKNKDGLVSYCKSCMRTIHEAVRRAKGQRPRRVVAPGFAYCPDCKTDKPVAEFPTNPSARRGAVPTACRVTTSVRGGTRSPTTGPLAATT